MTLRSMTRAGLPLLAGVLLWGTAARGDVIKPPPTNCPAGTKAMSCHGGPHCEPVTCVTDASCKAGLSCQSQQYCIKQINCAGGYGGPKYKDVAMGTCPGGAPCKVGTCKAVNVCVAKAPSPDAKPPAPDTKPPAPDSKQPAADTKQPIADTKQPAADTKKPTDTKQPAADTKQPAADTKQPAADTGGTKAADSDGCSCELPAGRGSCLLGVLGLLLLIVSRRRRR